MKKFAISLSKNIAAIAFWILVWFLVAKAIGVELILPTPWAVCVSLSKLVITEGFWVSSSMSFLRVLIGIIFSLMIGCICAFLMNISKIINTLLSPIMSVIKATPVASFIIIVWLWIEAPILPMFIASLIVIPVITANVTEGIKNVDKQLIEVANVYHLSTPKKLFKLYIPSIAPYFLAACKSSFGMAWKASVAAELIVVARDSIGKEIYLSKQNFESADVFAWTVVVIILSILFEKISFLLFNKLGSILKVTPKGEQNAQN